MQSIFSSPNPLLFGTGTSKLVGEKLREFGCKKVLVVYDAGIKNSGLADRIIKYINDAGIAAVTYDGVQADPPDWSVNEAGEIGLREKVDGVVGLGGGSSLDTAKGAKMLQTNPPPINQYFGRTGIVTKPSVPLVVIPTTAGTGSECTPGGVITDTKNNVKTNIAGTGCAVNLGIVDPELTLGLPPAVTASTGMDALCHAVESYTSMLSNSFCELTGKKAFTLIGKYLVRAYENGADLEASCLPQVMQVIAPAVPEKVKDITLALGGTVRDDAAPEEIGKAVYETVRTLMKRLRLPSLREFGEKNGFTKDDLLAVVPENVGAMQEGLVKAFGRGTSPVPAAKELIAAIVSRAYDEN
jgi:alcohol dehydrogenase class IV